MARRRHSQASSRSICNRSCSRPRCCHCHCRLQPADRHKNGRVRSGHGTSGVLRAFAAIMSGAIPLSTQASRAATASNASVAGPPAQFDPRCSLRTTGAEYHVSIVAALAAGANAASQVPRVAQNGYRIKIRGRGLAAGCLLRPQRRTLDGIPGGPLMPTGDSALSSPWDCGIKALM